MLWLSAFIHPISVVSCRPCGGAELTLRLLLEDTARRHGGLRETRTGLPAPTPSQGPLPAKRSPKPQVRVDIGCMLINNDLWQIMGRFGCVWAGTATSTNSKA